MLQLSQLQPLSYRLLEMLAGTVAKSLHNTKRYSSAQGEQLTLVSKTGFIHLTAANSSGRFDGMVSGNKSLSIALH